MSVEVLGFEVLFGRPCAVLLVRDYTSGKRKPYEWIDRAVRAGHELWVPVGKVPSGRWRAEANAQIEFEYRDALACGMSLPLSEAA